MTLADRRSETGTSWWGDTHHIRLVDGTISCGWRVEESAAEYLLSTRWNEELDTRIIMIDWPVGENDTSTRDSEVLSVAHR